MQDCKNFNIKHNITYLWMKGSQILMRIDENSRVFKIKTQNDLIMFEDELKINKTIMQ